MQWLKERLPSRVPALWLSSLRASVALTLTLALIFTRPFANLCSHPIALNGTLLVVVGSRPGRSVGGCLQDSILGLAGLGSGVICFVILAALRAAPVAQGFVFAFYVYLAALVRAGGAKYISFYLFGTLFAFNGIYMPIEGAASGEQFNYSYLLAVFQAYIWGIALALLVNLVLWPVTSEQELRRLLVGSLQHVSTLAHLTCKTYAKEIDEDEVEVRQLLVRTIRSDYLALAARLDETSYEILWTRFTFPDWQNMIKRVQGLQQALITSSSALELIDTLDPEGVNVKRHLLARAEASTTFGAFRRGIDLVIADIVDEVLKPGVVLHREADHSSPTTLPPNPSAKPQLKRVNSEQTLVKIDDISKRLRREVAKSEDRQMRSRRGSPERPARGTPQRRQSDIFGAEAGAQIDEATLERDLENGGAQVLEKEGKGLERKRKEEPRPRDTHDPVEYLRESWTAFAKAQADALIRLIRDGSLQVEDKLRIENGMPSLQAMYAERLPKSWTSSLIATTSLNKRRPSLGVPGSSDESHDTVTNEQVPSEDVPCSEALTKSYSLLFGFGQLTDELTGLHAIVGHHRGKRVRPYIFQTTWSAVQSWTRSRKDGMHLQEALALLRGEKYTYPKPSLLHRFVKFEKWLRSDRSLYALKVALGATIYTVFLLTPSLRERLFLRYGMVSSLITVLVAIAPTMGNTFSTWVLQMTGTGCGALYGLVVLEIFKNVGGYAFNPYGCVAAFWLWSLFASYVFYKYPKYYTGALLLVTGCGSMLVLEWLYNELPSVEQQLSGPYDSPPLRFGYTLASMCISIVISSVIQLFILRTPARRKLRLQIAAVTFALSSYNTLLQSNINLVAPADASPAPPPEALAQVQRELIKRERQIQSQILALGPTFEFARAEPTFATPFKSDVLLRIIRSHQIILDRLREARTAVGTEGFNDTMHKDFASCLFPYRLHSQRLARTLFFLGATSLVSKTQLARDVPSSKPTWAAFELDALVLSRRLSKLPRGEEELKRPGFLRYWFYLISLGAVSSELESLEEYLGELFGFAPELSNPQIL